jgi:tRNA (guanine37-N1)-methyltransferase
MARVEVVASLADAEAAVEAREGRAPALMATDAAEGRGRGITYAGARDLIAAGKVVMVLFGTAWGLDREVIERAQWTLPPIAGNREYNHLSVRGAAAVILDRLVGEHGAGSSEHGVSTQ